MKTPYAFAADTSHLNSGHNPSTNKRLRCSFRQLIDSVSQFSSSHFETRNACAACHSSTAATSGLHQLDRSTPVHASYTYDVSCSEGQIALLSRDGEVLQRLCTACEPALWDALLEALRCSPHANGSTAKQPCKLSWSNDTRLYHCYPRVDMQPVRRIDALHIMGPKLARPLTQQATISACDRLSKSGVVLRVMVGNRQFVQVCRGRIRHLQQINDTLHCRGDNFNLAMNRQQLASVWLVNPLNANCRRQTACLEGYDYRDNLSFKIQPEPTSPHRENWTRLFATL